MTHVLARGWELGTTEGNLRQTLLTVGKLRARDVLEVLLCSPDGVSEWALVTLAELKLAAPLVQRLTAAEPNLVAAVGSAADLRLFAAVRRQQARPYRPRLSSAAVTVGAKSELADAFWRVSSLPRSKRPASGTAAPASFTLPALDNALALLGAGHAPPAGPPRSAAAASSRPGLPLYASWPARRQLRALDLAAAGPVAASPAARPGRRRCRSAPAAPPAATLPRVHVTGSPQQPASAPARIMVAALAGICRGPVAATAAVRGTLPRESLAHALDAVIVSATHALSALGELAPGLPATAQRARRTRSCRLWRPLPHEAHYSDLLSLRAVACGALDRLHEDSHAQPHGAGCWALSCAAASDLVAALRVNPESTAAMGAFYFFVGGHVPSENASQQLSAYLARSVRVAFEPVFAAIAQSACLRAAHGSCISALECEECVTEAPRRYGALLDLHECDRGALERGVDALVAFHRVLTPGSFSARSTLLTILRLEARVVSRFKCVDASALAEVPIEGLLLTPPVLLGTEAAIVAAAADDAIDKLSVLVTNPNATAHSHGLIADALVVKRFPSVYSSTAGRGPLSAADEADATRAVMFLCVIYEQLERNSNVQLGLSLCFRLAVLASRLTTRASSATVLCTRVHSLFKRTFDARFDDAVPADASKPICVDLSLPACVALSGIACVDGAFARGALDSSVGEHYTISVLEQAVALQLPLPLLLRVYGPRSFGPTASVAQEAYFDSMLLQVGTHATAVSFPLSADGDSSLLTDALEHAVGLSRSAAAEFISMLPASCRTPVDGSRLTDMWARVGTAGRVDTLLAPRRRMGVQMAASEQAAMHSLRVPSAALLELPVFAYYPPGAALLRALLTTSLHASTADPFAGGQSPPDQRASAKCALNDSERILRVIRVIVAALANASILIVRLARGYSAAPVASLPALCALYRVFVVLHHAVHSLRCQQLTSASWAEKERVPGSGQSTTPALLRRQQTFASLVSELLQLHTALLAAGGCVASAFTASCEAAVAAGMVPASALHDWAASEAGGGCILFSLLPSAPASGALRIGLTRMLQEGVHLFPPPSPSPHRVVHASGSSPSAVGISRALEFLELAHPPVRNGETLALPLPPAINVFAQLVLALRKPEGGEFFVALGTDSSIASLRSLHSIALGVEVLRMVDARGSLAAAVADDDPSICDRFAQVQRRLQVSDVVVAAVGAVMAGKSRVAQSLIVWLRDNALPHGALPPGALSNSFSASARATQSALKAVVELSFLEVPEDWARTLMCADDTDTRLASDVLRYASAWPDGAVMLLHLQLATLSALRNGKLPELARREFPHERSVRLLERVCVALGDHILHKRSATAAGVLEVSRALLHVDAGVVADPALRASCLDRIIDQWRDTVRNQLGGTTSGALRAALFGAQAPAKRGITPKDSAPLPPATVVNSSAVLAALAQLRHVAGPGALLPPNPVHARLMALLGDLAPAARSSALEFATQQRAVSADAGLHVLTSLVAFQPFFSTGFSDAAHVELLQRIESVGDDLAGALTWALQRWAGCVDAARETIPNPNMLKRGNYKVQITALEARAREVTASLLVQVIRLGRLREFNRHELRSALQQLVKYCHQEVLPRARSCLRADVLDWFKRLGVKKIVGADKSLCTYEIVAAAHALAAAGRELEARLKAVDKATGGASGADWAASSLQGGDDEAPLTASPVAITPRVLESPPPVAPPTARERPAAVVQPAAVPSPARPEPVRAVDPAVLSPPSSAELIALMSAVTARGMELRAAKAAARVSSAEAVASAGDDAVGAPACSDDGAPRGSDPAGPPMPHAAAAPASPPPSSSATASSRGGDSDPGQLLASTVGPPSTTDVDGDEDDANEALPYSMADFQGASWDVRCVSKVVDRLCDASFPWVWHAQAIRTIFQLATGEWHVRSRNLHKAVQGVPPDLPGLKLYEARINRSRRVLWEVATEFSERLNRADVVASMGSSSSSSSSSSSTRGGRTSASASSQQTSQQASQQVVYSHVIRVWALIYDHDDISKEVARVVESHRRGGLSNVKRLLRVKDGDEPAVSNGVHLPRTFSPISEDAAKRLLKQARLATTSMSDAAAAAVAAGNALEGALLITLPAKVGGDEYVPEKFYAAAAVYNSILVEQARSFAQRLLSQSRGLQPGGGDGHGGGGGGGGGGEEGAEGDEEDDDNEDDGDDEEEGEGGEHGRAHAATDLQFVTSPLEHSIVTLNPRPPSSIVVLGRSGTGKTVCVLYRLFSQLLAYWDESVGGAQRPPAFPNHRPPLVALLHRRFKQEQQQLRRVARDAREAGGGGALADVAEGDDEDELGSDDDDERASVDSEAERRAANDEMLATGGAGEDFERSGGGAHAAAAAHNVVGSGATPLLAQRLDDHALGADGLEVGSVGSNVECDDEAVDDSLVSPYAHLRQVFVTRSERLCAGVVRAFRGLQHSQGAIVDPLSKEVRYLFPVDEFNPLPRRPVIPESLSYLHAHKAVFPLFLSARDWLVLLDNTLGGASFLKASELRVSAAAAAAAAALARHDSASTTAGSSGRSVASTSIDDETTIADELSDDGGSSFGGTATHAGRGGSDASTAPGGGAVGVGAWTGGEVTFREFDRQYWPRMVVKRSKHSALASLSAAIVWQEIRSSIKGSDEALQTERGQLPWESPAGSETMSYQSFPRKRCEHSVQTRAEIYRMFLLYERLKSQRHAFDEADLVSDLYRRLVHYGYDGVPLHQLYVDECQDHTQAEIKLFILLCADPNSLFLAGDTAQAISSGIAFRFADIRALFWEQGQLQARLAGGTAAVAQADAVGVPRLHQLTQNYRSHSGILDVAASVVAVINGFFPNSIDRMERDRGMYPGPKPRLILGSDVDKLALAMTGGARVEFGAEQVIIVRDEAAKRRLPPALRAAIVMTPAECKGLEFDDALLWDFFADSPAGGEPWRTLPAFLNDVAARAGDARAALDDLQLSSEVSDSLVRLDDDDDDDAGSGSSSSTSTLFSPTVSRRSAAAGGRGALHPWPTDCPAVASSVPARSLPFDAMRHKALEGELKALYVAVTRARKRLYIFDRGNRSDGVKECDWPRTCAFDFLERQGLVETLSGAAATNFAVASTADQWLKKGRTFKEAADGEPSLFMLAALCFDKGGAPVEGALCHARFYARQALDSKSAAAASLTKEGRVHHVRTMKVSAARAGEQYLRACTLGKSRVMRTYLPKAALCMRMADEHSVAARVYEELDNTSMAERCFVTGRDFLGCAALLKRLGRAQQGLTMLLDNMLYDAALDMVLEFGGVMDCGGKNGLHSVATIAKSALHHCIKTKTDVALRARVLPLVSITERLDALRAASDWEGMVEAHLLEGGYREAALQLLARGNLHAVAAAADVLQHAATTAGPLAPVSPSAATPVSPSAAAPLSGTLLPLLAACKLRIAVGCLTLLGLPPWLYAGAACVSSEPSAMPSFLDLAHDLYGEAVPWPVSLVGGEPIVLASVVSSRPFSQLVAAASASASACDAADGVAASAASAATSTSTEAGCRSAARLSTSLALAQAMALPAPLRTHSQSTDDAVAVAIQAFGWLSEARDALQATSSNPIPALLGALLHASYGVTLLMLMVAAQRLPEAASLHPPPPSPLDTAAVLRCYTVLLQARTRFDDAERESARLIGKKHIARRLLARVSHSLWLPFEWCRLKLGVTAASSELLLTGSHQQLPACALSASSSVARGYGAAIDAFELARDMSSSSLKGRELAVGAVSVANSDTVNIGSLAILDPLVLAGASTHTKLSEISFTVHSTDDPEYLVVGPATHSAPTEQVMLAVATALLRASALPAMALAHEPLLQLLAASEGAPSAEAISALTSAVRVYHEAGSRLPSSMQVQVVSMQAHFMTAMAPSDTGCTAPGDDWALFPRTLPAHHPIVHACCDRLLRWVIDSVALQPSGSNNALVLAAAPSQASGGGSGSSGAGELDRATCERLSERVSEVITAAPLLRLLGEPQLLLEAWLALCSLRMSSRFKPLLAAVTARFGAILQRTSDTSVTITESWADYVECLPTGANAAQWCEWAAAQAFNCSPHPRTPAELAGRPPPVGDAATLIIPATFLGGAAVLELEPSVQLLEQPSPLGTATILPRAVDAFLRSRTVMLHTWLGPSVAAYAVPPGMDLSRALSVAERVCALHLVATSRLAAMAAPADSPPTVLLLPSYLVETCLGASPSCWGVGLSESSSAAPPWVRALCTLFAPRHAAWLTSRPIKWSKNMRYMATCVSALLCRAVAACEVLDVATTAPGALYAAFDAVRRALSLALVCTQQVQLHEPYSSVHGSLATLLSAVAGTRQQLGDALTRADVGQSPELAQRYDPRPLMRTAGAVYHGFAILMYAFEQMPPVAWQPAVGGWAVSPAFSGGHGVLLLDALVALSVASDPDATRPVCVTITVAGGAASEPLEQWAALRVDAVALEGLAVPDALREPLSRTLSHARVCMYEVWPQASDAQLVDDDPHGAAAAEEEEEERRVAAMGGATVDAASDARGSSGSGQGPAPAAAGAAAPARRWIDATARLHIKAFVVRCLRRQQGRQKPGGDGWVLGERPDIDAYLDHSVVSYRLNAPRSTQCTACGMSYHRDDIKTSAGSAARRAAPSAPQLARAKGRVHKEHFPNVKRMRCFLLLHRTQLAPAVARGRRALKQLLEMSKAAEIELSTSTSAVGVVAASAPESGDGPVGADPAASAVDAEHHNLGIEAQGSCHALRSALDSCTTGILQVIDSQAWTGCEFELSAPSAKAPHGTVARIAPVVALASASSGGSAADALAALHRTVSEVSTHAGSLLRLVDELRKLLERLSDHAARRYVDKIEKASKLARDAEMEQLAKARDIAQRAEKAAKEQRDATLYATLGSEAAHTSVRERMKSWIGDPAPGREAAIDAELAAATAAIGGVDAEGDWTEIATSAKSKKKAGGKPLPGVGAATAAKRGASAGPAQLGPKAAAGGGGAGASAQRPAVAGAGAGARRPVAQAASGSWR